MVVLNLKLSESLSELKVYLQRVDFLNCECYVVVLTTGVK